MPRPCSEHQCSPSKLERFETVTYPDSDSQQLRVDYITYLPPAAFGNLGLGPRRTRVVPDHEETDSRQPQGSVLRENSQGFICPMCMEKLKSAEALQVHWESAHGNDFGGSVGTVHVTPAKKQPRCSLTIDINLCVLSGIENILSGLVSASRVNT
eukprot:Em0001g178a